MDKEYLKGLTKEELIEIIYNETTCTYQLQNNWNELKNGLKSLFEFEEGVVSKDYLECAEDTLEKMQEMEGNNDSKRDV